MIAASLALLIAAPAPDAFLARMQRRWVPACDTVEAITNVTARFRLNKAGYLAGDPVIIDRRTGLQIDPARPDAASAGAAAAGERAKKAIVSGQPYADVPPALVGRTLNLDFNAQAACS
ncbi:hypothetical protein QO010_002894 [Caulobacter ginsengisoli]|uniref:Uncharacterized protein n=1 Tax=Caulobacter ginsengisoli TaxID=400775 RepID=A0ABU0ISZ8_9CAUL|nr:hypothetical protein [Caulobacter ginsengisoli]MDQ0465110.1 hypothetical protein [Caulobacter ginsengisoli]